MRLPTITASGCVIHVYLINSLIQMYVCKYVHVCTCMYVFLYVVCMYMYIKALRYLDWNIGFLSQWIFVNQAILLLVTYLINVALVFLLSILCSKSLDILLPFLSPIYGICYLLMYSLFNFDFVNYYKLCPQFTLNTWPVLF